MFLTPIIHDGKPAYRGASGTIYQYDLSKPSDKLRYEVDLMAQMRDSLSVNLYRKVENGGGIYE